jgi:aryl-alcohol dehydrogenase-like predicted oxidoreductase
MNQRQLGTQGLTVSAIGFGAMGLSDFYSTSGSTESEAIALIRKAISLGVTLIDTADVYGPHANEVLVGKAVKGYRDRVMLATKFGIVRDPRDRAARGVNGHPEYVRRSCEDSLKRLGVERIDLYYQHRVDPQVPIEETVGAMSDLVKHGKVRYLGLSEAAPETIRRAFAVHPITAIQTEWSLWERSIEDEVLPLTRELGIGVVPYSPLGRGALTGAVASRADLKDGDHRAGLPWYSGENFDHNMSTVDVVRGIAAEVGATPGQVALAWLLAKAPDVVPIPGTRRVAYLEQNSLAANVTLSPEHLGALDAIRVVGAREHGTAVDAQNWFNGTTPARTGQ